MSCIAAAALYRISKALLVFCCVVGPTRAVFLTVGRAAKGDSSNKEQLAAGAPASTTVRLFATSAAGNPDPTRELLLNSDDASVGLGSGGARALTAVRTSNFGSFLASPFTLDPVAGAEAVLGTKVCELARIARATLNTSEFVRGGGVKAEEDIDVSDADAGQLQDEDTYDVVALTDYDATNDAGGHDCSESDGSSATSLCEGCSQHDHRCQIIDDVESLPGGPPSSEKGCSRSSSFGSSLSTACSSSGSSAEKRERRRKFLEQQEKAVPSETRACLQLANRWVSFGLNCNDVLLCCDVPFPAEGPAGRRGTLKVRTLLVALDGPHEPGTGVVRGDAAIDRHVAAVSWSFTDRVERSALRPKGANAEKNLVCFILQQSEFIPVLEQLRSGKQAGGVCWITRYPGMGEMCAKVNMAREGRDAKNENLCSGFDLQNARFVTESSRWKRSAHEKQQLLFYQEEKEQPLRSGGDQEDENSSEDGGGADDGAGVTGTDGPVLITDDAVLENAAKRGFASGTSSGKKKKKKRGKKKKKSEIKNKMMATFCEPSKHFLSTAHSSFAVKVGPSAAQTIRLPPLLHFGNKAQNSNGGTGNSNSSSSRKIDIDAVLSPGRLREKDAESPVIRRMSQTCAALISPKRAPTRMTKNNFFTTSSGVKAAAKPAPHPHPRQFVLHEHMPKTFVYPEDEAKIAAYLEPPLNSSVPPRLRTLICKPEDSSQGHGIFMINRLRDLQVRASTSRSTLVVQEYIDTPLLLHGYKFDLRVYVVLSGLGRNFRVFIGKEALVRFCTKKYEMPFERGFLNGAVCTGSPCGRMIDAHSEDLARHLCNYSINKKSKDFVRSAECDEGLLQKLDELMGTVGCARRVDLDANFSSPTRASSKSQPILFVKEQHATVRREEKRYFDFRGASPQFAGDVGEEENSCGKTASAVFSLDDLNAARAAASHQSKWKSSSLLGSGANKNGGSTGLQNKGLVPGGAGVSAAPKADFGGILRDIRVMQKMCDAKTQTRAKFLFSPETPGGRSEDETAAGAGEFFEEEEHEMVGAQDENAEKFEDVDLRARDDEDDVVCENAEDLAFGKAGQNQNNTAAPPNMAAANNTASKRLLSVVLEQIEQEYPARFSRTNFYEQLSDVCGQWAEGIHPYLIATYRPFYFHGEPNGANPEDHHHHHVHHDSFSTSPTGASKSSKCIKNPKHFYEHNQARCCQMLGFDLLLDDNFKLHLIEVNSGPSLNVDDVVPLEECKKSAYARPPCMCGDYPEPHRHEPSPIDMFVKTHVMQGFESFQTGQPYVEVDRAAYTFAPLLRKLEAWFSCKVNHGTKTAGDGDGLTSSFHVRRAFSRLRNLESHDLDLEYTKMKREFVQPYIKSPLLNARFDLVDLIPVLEAVRKKKGFRSMEKLLDVLIGGGGKGGK
eukprot:g7153.t1